MTGAAIALGFLGGAVAGAAVTAVRLWLTHRRPPTRHVPPSPEVRQAERDAHAIATGTRPRPDDHIDRSDNP